MASKEAATVGEETGGTEEETIALRKKRSRRVSFAETTAIHLFTRDDDYETPPDPDPVPASLTSASASDSSTLPRTASDEFLELMQSSSSSSSSDDSDADVAPLLNKSFIRPVDSPSSATAFGSAASIDEDNFFGPVSMNFIKPRRLSDSAASDENHDITMDSTAFSMHFRSLAPSDSVGDSKTPTGIHLAVGERTPGQISTTNSVGDLMVLTASRKPTSHSSLPDDRVHDSGHSDDMSLVSENPRTYDYGKLPLALDVLLAEGGKDVGAVSLNRYASPLKKNIASSPDQKRHELLDVPHIYADIAVGKGAEKTSAAAVSAADMHFHKKTGATSNAPVTLVENPCNKSDSLDDDPVTALPIDNQGMPSDKDEKTRGILTKTSGNLGPPSSRTQLNVNHEQLEGSFDAGSTSSLLAKRRKIFKVPVSSTNDDWSWTPLARELSVKGSIKNVWSTSFFSKGVSRLKRLEAFPFASTSKAEGVNTRSINNVDAPVARLEARFSDVAKNSGEFVGKVGDNSLCSVGNMEHEMSTEAIEDMRSSSLTTGLSSLERFRKNIKKMDSPSLTGSQKKGLDHHMSKDNHATVTQQSTRTDSSFPEIRLNKYSRPAVMSDYSAFPSDNGSENQVSGSSQYREYHSMSGNQQGQSHLKLDQGVALQEAGILASRIEASAFLLSDRKQVTNVSSDVEHAKLDESSTPSNRRSCTPSLGFQTVQDKVSESSELFGSDAFHGTNELQIQGLKSPKGHLSFSWSHREPYFLVDNANMHLAREDVPTPIQLTTKDDEDDKISQKESFVCGIDSSSGQRRKYEGFGDEAQHNNDEYSTFPHKLHLHGDQNHLDKSKKISCNVGGDAKSRHWTNLFTSLCGLTTQLLSPFIEKLDRPQMEKLDDILVHLEKVKRIECLSHNICSQKTFDAANYLQNKRVMDVRSLLYCTVYRKAKLQLLNLKRDKLLDQVQQLHFRVQDSETLKSSFLCSHLQGQKDVQADCTRSESSPIDIDDRGSDPTGFSSLRKELEESDRKINNLKESFYTYLKIAKEPTCANVTECAINFLKERVFCRSLLPQFQLCEIESLTVKNGEFFFLFNHHGFLSQRFSVNVNSTSTVSISTKLNDLKIPKFFHNMDAYTGFSFMFGGETTVIFTGSRTITQETQKTHSMLHNLLDVVEEVQLALMELRNLTHSRFSLPSAGKLDLLLCFRDFKSGAKVTLKIDVTCLNRGVYPSHVVPYEVQGRAAGNDESFQILLSNITTGLKGLRCGYMRIINLCRCVSKMMQVR